MGLKDLGPGAQGRKDPGPGALGLKDPGPGALGLKDPGAQGGAQGGPRDVLYGFYRVFILMFTYV